MVFYAIFFDNNWLWKPLISSYSHRGQRVQNKKDGSQPPFVAVVGRRAGAFGLSLVMGFCPHAANVCNCSHNSRIRH